MLSGDGTGDGTSVFAGTALADPSFEEAVAGLESAMDTLRASKTGLLTGPDHLSLLARTETVKRALDGYQHTLINETLEQGGFDGIGGSAPNALSMILRITVRKASERLAIAKQLGLRTAFTGKKIAPLLPHTASAASDGAADPAHVAIIRDFLRKVPSTVDPETVENSEEELARLARSLAPDQLRAAAERILALIDPDGAEPTDDDTADLCFIHFDKQEANGLTRGKFRIDAEFRALLETIIDAVGKPGARKGKKGDGTGDDASTGETSGDAPAAEGDEPVVEVEPEAETPHGTTEPEPELELDLDLAADDRADSDTADPDRHLTPVPDPAPSEPKPRDTRSRGRRVHDNIKDILQRLLESGLLGKHRGVSAKAIITMTLRELETATGLAITATGSFVPIREALRMIAHAHPYLLLFDDDGRPIYLGRGKRLATEDQRLALFATQRGCTFPGCTRPATRCQVHHVTDWAKCGATDADCLCFACDRHHHLVKDSGWATSIAPADHPYPGRTLWHPPAWLDPKRTGRLNHYHHPGEYLWDPETG